MTDVSEPDGTAPLVSFVTPTFRPPPGAFERLTATIHSQDDTSWEWIIVDDGSHDIKLSEAIGALVAADPRIRSVMLESNVGIGQATNRALSAATGQFIAFVDHDDTISTGVVAAVRRIATLVDEADVIYTDETYLSADADQVILDRDFEFRKPAWSPERLRAQNYLNHLTVVRRSLAESIGGIRSGFEGAQDHDFVLRATEQAREIVHIPEALYQWREAPESVLSGLENKPEAWEAGRRAVTDHLARVGIDAEVSKLSIPGVGDWYGVRPRLAEQPLVALITTVMSGAEVGNAVITACTAWERADYPNLHTVIVAQADDVAAHLNEVLRMEMLRRGLSNPYDTVVIEGAKRQVLLNAGAACTDAAAMVFVEPGAQLRTHDWVRLLAGVALQRGVGAVGARCLRTPDEIDNAGAILYRGLPRPLLRGYGPRATAYGTMALVPGERGAVTSQCVAIAADRFTWYGGFSERYDAHFYDIDLCLKMGANAWRSICQTQVDALVISEHFPLGWHDDIYRLQERWGTQLDVDPYLNVRDQETVQ